MGIFKKKKFENPQIINFINRRAIKYVSARDENDTECVLGRNGSINITGDDLVIVCDGTEVFRCDAYTAEIGELLSRDGVRIKGTTPDGKSRNVTAYYVYRR